MNRSRLFFVKSWDQLKPWFWWILKAGISGGILFLIFRQVNLSEILYIANNTKPVYLLLAIIMFFPAQALMAYRWFILLNQFGLKSPYKTVFRVNLVGQLSTIVLPGQLMGDIVRILALNRTQGNLSKITISALMDKLFLLVAVSFFAVMGSFIPSIWVRFSGVIWPIYGLFIASILSVVLLGRTRSKKLESWIATIAQKSPSFFQKKVLTFRSLTFSKVPWHVMGILLVLAFFLQMLNILGSFLLAQAFHFTSVPLFAWAVIHSIVSLVQVLPVSIGGLGLREGAFVILLAPYGISTAQAFGYSLSGFLVINILLVIVWLILNTRNFKKVIE